MNMLINTQLFIAGCLFLGIFAIKIICAIIIKILQLLSVTKM